MPSIVTHYLFSEDALKKIPIEVNQKILQAHKLYNIFAQSFDNLFYYNLLSVKSGKNIREFGNNAQRKNTNLYFKNLITNIKNEKLEHNSEILAYLYGSLTHYVLDSNCHPFVIYQTGWINKEFPNYEYKGLHEKMEVNIDAILYEEKTGKKLYQASLGNILLPKANFSSQLINIITKTYEQTFQEKNIGKIYEKSTKQGHYIIKYFVTDHFGLKKITYKIFDLIFYKNLTKYQNLSFFVTNPNMNYMNRNHEKWYNPTDKQIQSTESFDDLYQKALKEIEKIFVLTNQVLKKELELETYLEELGNKSYTTGKDCNQKENFKYFNKNLIKKQNFE